MTDPISTALGAALGITLYQLVKHLLSGVIEVTRASKTASLSEWRAAQQAGWRITRPTPREEDKIPHLGISLDDIPCFAKRSRK